MKSDCKGKKKRAKGQTRRERSINRDIRIDKRIWEKILRIAEKYDATSTFAIELSVDALDEDGLPIDALLRRQYEDAAVEHGMSPQEFLREAIRLYLKHLKQQSR